MGNADIIRILKEHETRLKQLEKDNEELKKRTFGLARIGVNDKQRTV